MTDYSKRENCPLDVGDIITGPDGGRMKFIDWPTDGPLFELLDAEPLEADHAVHGQYESDEFAQLWENGDLKRQ